MHSQITPKGFLGGIDWTASPMQFPGMPGGAVGYPTQPRFIAESVSPSVRDSSFNYSAENLLIPTIKATIKTSWY